MNNGELTTKKISNEINKIEKDKQEIFDFIKEKGYQLVVNLLDPVVQNGKLKSNVYVDLVPLSKINIES